MDRLCFHVNSLIGMMYRGKYVLFYPVTLNKLTTPSTNHLPRAFVFGICHFYFDSKQFWHPATASGFLTRFWNKTSHGRTLSKKKKTPAIKINQNIAMERRHGSWTNHLWTDINGTWSFTRLEWGSECQWMRSKMTWSNLSMNQQLVFIPKDPYHHCFWHGMPIFTHPVWQWSWQFVSARSSPTHIRWLPQLKVVLCLS